MSTFDEHGISGRLTIEKARVWDLRTTGQVTSGNRTTAGISCVCFHPTEPTLCVVTVQGSFSVLSFYNAHSGGKMSTVQLQSVVSAAEFTKDGSRIVAIFRDWTVMMLRPGSPAWSRQQIPFKKDTKPAEQLLMALSPMEWPVIYFAASGQPKINVAFSSVPAAKGTLLSSSQKNSFSTKLSTMGITGLACHPQETDVLFTMLADGVIQAFVLEQASLKRLFSIGDSVQGPDDQLCQFEVVPHPFVSNSVLILSAAAQKLTIYVSHDRTQIGPVDLLPLRGFKRVIGLGIHKEAQLLFAFGELEDQSLSCVGVRMTGTEESIWLVPVNVSFGDSAMDISIPSASVNGIVNVTDRGDGSWMELWDTFPAWAQSSFLLGSMRSKIRNVKIHSISGAIAAPSITGSGIGPHVILWSIKDASHPLGGSYTGLVMPQHTSLSLWSGKESVEEYKIEFPHHCYFVDGNKLCGYGFRSKAVTDVFTFYPPGGRSGPAKAENATFSTVHRAWLVFFRSFSKKNGTSGIEDWTYTLQREDEVGASPPWFNPGISGVFVGPREDHFCILAPDLYTVHVFPTKTVTRKDAPLLSLSLPSPGLFTPSLFQGPPITQIPKPPPPPEFTDSGMLMHIAEETDEKEVKLGYGVIIWVNKFRQIAMGTLISESTNRSRYDSDVEYIQGGTFNELAEGEIIIQVSWQKLCEAEDAHQAPNSFTAAILTSRRLMLFLANGYPVLSFPQQNTPGLYSPPVSCLWVGPALLYVTQSGEVNQLLWDGSTVMICGAPSTTGSAILAAALGDRILFVCREKESQSWNVATRHAIIAYVLLMGWASLSSSGLMPPAWVHAQARNQMKWILQHFDVGTVSAPVARALVRSGFADVARIVANRWPSEAQKIKVACNVAAKKWSEAAEGLLNEYKQSVYPPGPIPLDSTMWKRFYSVASGAVRHGNSEVAANLFAAAGEYERALVFLSISAKFSKMQEILQNVSKQLSPKEVTRLQSLVDELKKRAQLQPSSEMPSFEIDFDDLASWTFAAPGYLAPMVCVQGDTPQGMIKDGDLGQIDPLETQDIKGYVSGESRSTAGKNFIRRTITETMSSRSLVASIASKGSHSTIPEVLEVGGGSTDFFAVQTSSLDKTETPKSPDRGFGDIGFETQFSSDEEESVDTQDDDRTAAFGKKFKIQIKKKEETHTGTSSEALREAAKKLRLGGSTFNPSLGPAGFAAAMKGSGGVERTESMSSVSSSQSHVDARFSPT